MRRVCETQSGPNDRQSTILYWIISMGRIRWIKLESFRMPASYSWLFGVMFMTPDWESVGCEFEYRNLYFLKERLSLISLTEFKIGKTQ